jgi:hypothetical protein
VVTRPGYSVSRTFNPVGFIPSLTWVTGAATIMRTRHDHESASGGVEKHGSRVRSQNKGSTPPYFHLPGPQIG